MIMILEKLSESLSHVTCSLWKDIVSLFTPYLMRSVMGNKNMRHLFLNSSALLRKLIFSEKVAVKGHSLSGNSRLPYSNLILFAKRTLYPESA